MVVKVLCERPWAAKSAQLIPHEIDVCFFDHLINLKRVVDGLLVVSLGTVVLWLMLLVRGIDIEVLISTVRGTVNEAAVLIGRISFL